MEICSNVFSPGKFKRVIAFIVMIGYKNIWCVTYLLDESKAKTVMISIELRSIKAVKYSNTIQWILNTGIAYYAFIGWQINWNAAILMIVLDAVGQQIVE